MAKRRKKQNVNVGKIIKGILITLILLGCFALIFSLFREDKSPNVGGIINNSSEVIDSENSSEEKEENKESEEVSSEESSSENVFVSAFHFTLVGSMNEWDITNDDYLFTTTDDVVFNLNVDLAVGDEFKIANDNAWDWQYNINNVVESSKQYVDTSSTDNIKMIAEGNYDIELNIVNHIITLAKN